MEKFFKALIENVIPKKKNRKNRGKSRLRIATTKIRTNLKNA